MKANLTSIPTLVESPFIIATIGGVKFGSFKGSKNDGHLLNVTYPNFMNSIDIKKINGTVNQYTLKLSYQVGINQDPNLLDKIISKATQDRKIRLTYGDWNAPTQIYKDEEAIITGVSTALNMRSNSLDYTISCTSDSLNLTSTTYNFPRKKCKGSELLIQLLRNKRLGLTQIFKGMKNINRIIAAGLIPSNDATIEFLPQTNINILNYLNYVVDSMVNSRYSGLAELPSSKYFLSIHDDVNNEFGGTYFKITEVSSDTNTVDATDTYELNINYPTDNFVTEFSLNNDQSWAILYEYSEGIQQEQYSYNIDDNGQLHTQYSPSILKSSYTGQLSPTKAEWWARMTKFPIQATVTIKGLTRPSILMSYVKLNVWFAGGIKHISSGLYVITEQNDTLNASGYKTTLKLLRVGGDS